MTAKKQASPFPGESQCDIPGFAEFEAEMDRINAEIDSFLEQSRKDNEAFLQEIDLTDSPRFELPDVEELFKPA
ncbi:hypothetical protein ACFL43_01195 [Thermodesulfobacteriota bacterium]